MKTNLLVTLILGEKHNSFIIKNKPDNYIGILIDKIKKVLLVKIIATILLLV